jgi:hypothetical protein
MLLAEKLTTLRQIQRRTFRRVEYTELCFAQSDSHALWVKARNLSERGICLFVDEVGALKKGTRVALFLQDFPAIDASVRWKRRNHVGLLFTSPIDDHPQIKELVKRILDGGPARIPDEDRTDTTESTDQDKGI